MTTSLGCTDDGRYLLRRAIAQGAMGEVFEARHQVTGRRVALKRPLRHQRDDDDLRMRFRREARVLGAAAHPLVVGILDASVEGDDPYIVLELLEGRTLEGALIAQRMLPPLDAIAITIDLCDALAAIHDAGVLHRDIKPGNIFLTEDERGRRSLKLIDFGVAAFDERRLDGAETVISSSRLTLPGGIVGTPEYMAPEQLRGERADVRVDLYAAGVTLFEMLTGRVPFSGGLSEVFIQVETARKAPSVRTLRPEVSETLAAAIARALSYDRAARFSSAREMAAALEVVRAALLAPPSNRSAVGPRVMLADLPDGHLAHTLAAYRRRHARVPYVTPAKLHLDGEVFEGRTQDISVGGLMLLTGARCEDGKRLEVELALPDTGTIVRVSGVARWRRSGRGDHGALGVELNGLPDNARHAIERLVDRLRPRSDEGQPATAD